MKYISNNNTYYGVAAHLDLLPRPEEIVEEALTEADPATEINKHDYAIGCEAFIWVKIGQDRLR